MNLILRNLQSEIVNAVNSARVPTEAKRLVVLEVLMKLEAQVEREIALELEDLKKKESE